LKFFSRFSFSPSTPPSPPHTHQDQEPPKSLHVEIRVLEDCGEIMTDRGPVRLARNTQHHLRRSDVAMLIKRGKVEQIESRD
jgi:hypothetical protein